MAFQSGDIRSAFGLVCLAVGLSSAGGCSSAPTAKVVRAEAEKPQKLEKLDPSVATSQAADGKLIWYDGWKLRLEGKGWSFTEDSYDRLPAKAKGVVRDAVWGLSKQSAGLAVRFVTDARSLAIHWVLTGKDLGMFHMPATGMSGVDVYVRRDGGWRWIAIGKAMKAENLAEVAGLPPGMHEYMLYLPLYNGVETLRIGVPPGSVMARPEWRAGKPIVFYGTSITQGGCASRPGMVYPAIIGRRLDRETINLGFSGNGRMDPEVADLLGEIDASAYVLDCMPNMTLPMVSERVVPFVQALHKAQPRTPIVLVESITYPAQLFIPNPSTGSVAHNRLLREQYDKLIAAGVTGLHYVSGEHLYGDDGEGTVDGCHATDLGFFRFADVLEPQLRAIIELRVGG